MYEDLKGCPFCGGSGDEITLWVRKGRYNKFCYIECDVCGAKTKAFDYRSSFEEVDWKDIGAKKAINAWNRRA